MSNPAIIETYKGINIRKCNVVKLRFGVSAFKRLIDECENSGLSIQKVLAYSGTPCEKCKDSHTNVYDNIDGHLIKIKKGLLHIPESNGNNIIQKANKRNGKSS